MARLVRVRVDRAQANLVAQRFGDRLVTLAMLRTHARASVLAPVRTGNLRARMEMSKRVTNRFVRATVFNDTKYAMAVHDGTPPHTIRPRRKKALWWEGLAHPVARVNHPGTAARPFLARALLEECAPMGFRVTRL